VTGLHTGSVKMGCRCKSGVGSIVASQWLVGPLAPLAVDVSPPMWALRRTCMQLGSWVAVVALAYLAIGLGGDAAPVLGRKGDATAATPTLPTDASRRIIVFEVHVRLALGFG
jgi:hypothetical protein